MRLAIIILALVLAWTGLRAEQPSEAKEIKLDAQFAGKLVTAWKRYFELYSRIGFAYEVDSSSISLQRHGMNPNRKSRVRYRAMLPYFNFSEDFIGPERPNLGDGTLMVAYDGSKYYHLDRYASLQITADVEKLPPNVRRLQVQNPVFRPFLYLIKDEFSSNLTTNIQNPVFWSKVIAQISKVEAVKENGNDLLRLSLNSDRGDRMSVYLDPKKEYLPIRSERERDTSFSIIRIDSLKTLNNGIYLPLEVYSEKKMADGELGYTRVKVIEDSIQEFNSAQNLRAENFTIPFSHAQEVYDIDAEVRLKTKDAAAPR
ncbi:MAG: hypothetical protein AAGK14_14820 [Verrucomicrobiota bacterium]